MSIQTFGVAGCGVIGAGWAARALAHGLQVVAWDPAPSAEQQLREAVANAWPALEKVGLYEGASLENLRFCASLEEMAQAADFIQEAAPERMDLKKSLFAQLDAAARPEVIIASSTSGLLPTEFQSDCARPQRVVVGHPFNPVYLLPLVEVLGGEGTDPEKVDQAIEIYRELGMYPLKVRKEIEGFLSDRLQEALWREVLHLVNDGVATTEELDAAISYGPGLRYAIWGTCLNFHLAGGQGGMRHMLKHFDPAQFPWTKLEPPPISDELIERMAEGCEAQAGDSSIRELEQLRDNCLIAIMQALRNYQVGAGNVVHDNEARRIKQRPFARWQAGDDIGTPLQLYTCRVLPEWVDYNQHMTEAAYLTAAGWGSDALFRYIGDDEEYRASGYSFYTAESHVSYWREAHVGDALRVDTQLLGLDEKRLHFVHTLYNDKDEPISAIEQMLLHVDMNAGRACPIKDHVFDALKAIWAVHKHQPAPEGVGRLMKVKTPL